MSQSSYAAKRDLDAREAQWYGGKQPRLTHEGYPASNYASKVHSPGAKKAFTGNNSLLPHVDQKLSESAAMEMEQVRLRMQEQRDQTEAMIEQLMIAHEEARKERESLVVELASMSADSGKKLLVKVITRMCRMQLVMAWQAWHGNTTQFTKMQLQEKSKALKADLASLRRRIEEAQRDIDERIQLAADSAFKNATVKQRQLLLNIFGRLAGQKSRESFYVWRDAMEDFRRKYTLTLRMLMRLSNARIMIGWKKWYYETFLKSKMSLEEKTKALYYEIGLARELCNVKEKQLEKVVSEITRLMIQNASPKQRALMVKILSKCCSMLLRYGVKKWKQKTHLFKHARKTMGIIISRLCNSEINYGFRKWHMVCIKMTETSGELVVAKLKGQISILKGHHETSTNRIEEMSTNIRKMRESVTLRHSAMSQIAQGAEEVDLEIKLLIAECRGDTVSIAQGRAKFGSNSMHGSPPQRRRRDNGEILGLESVDANTRAHLLVFLQNLDHAQPQDTIGALATHPGLPKHKAWLKKYVLLGDQQVAAAIRAYEFTLDTDDFIESLDMIKKLSDV
ncbi:unnamed protein product [Pelagomonas calceolata]|jgi:hypothetical protein|uniref:Uncharacterized protein n=1 Tax=Pelagomonas calceolata TaxID=35677 RepID=A0A7S4E374_9STRA|nr:unnamed protein product [Pelagomonas calceolata]|tara:strand:+ start:365 stop:2062 length:1698 start_codon:yes stop_codon:yes gene_type:complete|mmetsp:Transcript_8103/g.24020  ORF Transcript_8103/g.24020 Transcript_8103/m.24020 type:complete len:566 (+) Transcript_8103:71-1768(+)